MKKDEKYIITANQLSMLRAWCKTGVIKNGHDSDNYAVVKDIFASLQKIKDEDEDEDD